MKTEIKILTVVAYLMLISSSFFCGMVVQKMIDVDENLRIVKSKLIGENDARR